MLLESLNIPLRCSCAHTLFAFLFIFVVQIFDENMQNSMPFQIFKEKSISSKWRIQLYCTYQAK